jgi:hypothetical protein
MSALGYFSVVVKARLIKDRGVMRRQNKRTDNPHQLCHNIYSKKARALHQ